MKKILYWPGRGQDLTILRNFRDELQKNKFKIEHINIKYDNGELAPDEWKQVYANNADWWIGISLGASLLYYSYNLVGTNKPSRITLINPFSSREILSREKNFDLKNQWNFTPKSCNLEVEKLDVVLSIRDTKIPMYHGIELLNNTVCKDKEIIFIEGNHIIDNKDAQIELAKTLLESKKMNGGKNNEGNNYCNIYKHQ